MQIRLKTAFPASLEGSFEPDLVKDVKTAI
jgi:hypothetical protein